MAAARLYGQFGLREQAGIFGGALGGERDVVLARDQQDRCPKAGEGGAGGFRVQGAGRVVGGRRVRICLACLLGEVGLGNGVPSAVGEGGDRRPVSGRGVARPDPLECGEGVREPGLAPAPFGDLALAPGGRPVRRGGGLSGYAQVQQHQRAMRGQPAQVTEVGRGLHGAAGNTISGPSSPAWW